MNITQSIPLEASLAILFLSILNIADAYRLARVRNQRLDTATGDEGERRCPHCGHEVDAEFDFCQWCSEPLDVDSS